MDSRGHVRHFSKTACLVILLLSTEASAGIDAPGWVSFHFLAEPDVVYRSLDEIPEDAHLSEAYTRAYFSTDASSFGEFGVRTWAGFDLSGPDGPRHGMLLLDLDLQGHSRYVGSSLHAHAVRAEYVETSDDRVLFEGAPVAILVWVDDMLMQDGDSGAIEGAFECIFVDPSDQQEGSRVFVGGTFATDRSPYQERQDRDYPPDHDNDTYVESGCSSDVYVKDDSGCEGDTYDDDTGCGGSDDYDYGGSSDCEGDTYDSGYSDSASCEGDDYDSSDSVDCEGDEAYAAVRAPRKRRTNPLRALMRMLPEIVGISFIIFMKRRSRAV